MRANFGTGKRTINVTAQLASGTTPPAGTTTAGSVFELTGPGLTPQQCTTTSPDATSATSSCFFFFFLVDDSQTFTVTQVSAPGTLSIDPTAQNVPGCSQNARVPDCTNVTLVFTLAVPQPPTASSDTATTKADTKVTIDVLDNDDLNGSALTSLTITAAPSHGTAVVDDTDAEHPVIVYTPADGYAGPDSIGYTVQTANGTASSTASVTVTAAATSTPTAPATTPTTKPSSTPTSTPTSAQPTSPSATSSPTKQASSIEPAVVASSTSPAEVAPADLAPGGLAATGATAATGPLVALGLLLSGGGLAALRGGRHPRVRRRPGRHAR